MILRILVSLALFLAILYMPFWLSVFIGFLGMIYFSFFWESVGLFLLSDLLYGVREERFLNIFFVSFAVSFFTILIVEIIKKKVRIFKLEKFS